MTIARKNIVDNKIPSFYHCTNRCVRQTFLCGVDKLTGKDHSHRKNWLEKRMFELCDIFSVDIYAYAAWTDFCSCKIGIPSILGHNNHYHISVASRSA